MEFFVNDKLRLQWPVKLRFPLRLVASFMTPGAALHSLEWCEGPPPLGLSVPGVEPWALEIVQGRAFWETLEDLWCLYDSSC